MKTIEWWWSVVWAICFSAPPLILNNDPWFGIWAFVGCLWGAFVMRLRMIQVMRSNFEVRGRPHHNETKE